MKQIFPFLLLFLAFSLSAQSDVTKVFEMSPSLYDLGKKVLPQGDGFAVFGTLGGSSNTNGDIFLLRLDKDGNEIGRHIIGESNKTESMERGVVAVGNDGWLLAGWQMPNGTFARFGYLSRVGANGNVLWSKTLTGVISGTYFTALAALPTGGYIAAGQQTSETLVARLTETGDVVWLKKYGADVARGVFVSAGGGNCFVAKRDQVLKIRTSDGSLVWGKPLQTPVFGSADGDINVDVEDIVPVGNGMFAIVGTALNDEIFSFEQAPYTSLWKENGEMLWAEAFPKSDATGAGGGTGNSSIYMPNEQNLLLAGEGDSGINVTRIDLEGNRLAVYNIPTPALSIFPAILKHQGKYVLTGGCFTNGMNTLFYRSDGNWLPGGNLRPGDRDDVFQHEVMLFPSPASSTINLRYHSNAQSTVLLSISNALGELTYEAMQPVMAGENYWTINVEWLSPGIYWLSMPGLGLPAVKWVKQ